MWNGDQLPEQVYQPLGLQNDCAAVLDNYPKVMIEIHHGGKLFLINYKAHIFGIGLKFLYTNVISVFSCQSTNNLFEIYPPAV